MRNQSGTPDLLAQALRKRMTEDPIERISVKSITDQCGLNRQTFYYHFHDIYELVRWMYLQDIQKALDESFKQDDWLDSLLTFLSAIDKDRACHLALYKSDVYYTELRNEFYEMASTMLLPLITKKQPMLARLEAGYREFLVRMYVLVLFEYVEKRARGIAFSTEEEFASNWTRCLEEQWLGMRVKAQS